MWKPAACRTRDVLEIDFLCISLACLFFRLENLSEAAEPLEGGRRDDGDEGGDDSSMSADDDEGEVSGSTSAALNRGVCVLRTRARSGMSDT